MPQRSLWIVLSLGLLAPSLLAFDWAVALAAGSQPPSSPQLQGPTATPPPIRVEVRQDSVNVRNGPGTQYDQVGVLIPGQNSAILGRSPDGQWVQIVYVGGPDNIGWVWVGNIAVVGEMPTIPTILPPPTATVPPTSTPAPGEESGLPTLPPSLGRPPTFTPPAPQIRPTLLPVQGARPPVAFPPAVLIIILFVLGSFGGLLSVLRQR